MRTSFLQRLRATSVRSFFAIIKPGQVKSLHETIGTRKRGTVQFGLRCPGLGASDCTRVQREPGVCLQRLHTIVCQSVRIASATHWWPLHMAQKQHVDKRRT